MTDADIIARLKAGDLIVKTMRDGAAPEYTLLDTTPVPLKLVWRLAAAGYIVSQRDGLPGMETPQTYRLAS